MVFKFEFCKCIADRHAREQTCRDGRHRHQNTVSVRPQKTTLNGCFQIFQKIVADQKRHAAKQILTVIRSHTSLIIASYFDCAIVFAFGAA